MQGQQNWGATSPNNSIVPDPQTYLGPTGGACYGNRDISGQYDCFEVAPPVALLRITAFLHDIKADSTLILKSTSEYPPMSCQELHNENSNSVMISPPIPAIPASPSKRSTRPLQTRKNDVEHMRARSPHFTLNRSMHF